MRLTIEISLDHASDDGALTDVQRALREIVDDMPYNWPFDHVTERPLYDADGRKAGYVEIATR